MNIQVTMNSDYSIYEQIGRQIKELIFEGKLIKDEQLPSIRKLATKLTVGVITVKRAYDELINEGYLYSMPGKGVFVAQIDIDFVRKQYQLELKTKMEDLIPLIYKSGLSNLDVIKMFRKMMEE